MAYLTSRIVAELERSECGAPLEKRFASSVRDNVLYKLSYIKEIKHRCILNMVMNIINLKWGGGGMAHHSLPPLHTPMANLEVTRM